MKKVAVGISGGVDSAVSALLLKRAGYDVVGVHLYCWPPKSEIEKDGITREEWIKKNGCRADEDRQMALKTCLELEIPFKTLDFSEEYNQRVIKYFYDEYEAGRTPNPDVLCNSEIKFGLFLEWAIENGFDYIATGHYAKLVYGKSELPRWISPFGDQRPDQVGNDNSAGLLCSASNDEVRLMIPEDKHKDQTYFLWKLNQKELSHVLFPLGDLEKSKVREIAKEAKLSVAERKDSQGICFVGNVEVRDFLARRLKINPGKVIDTKGNEIGIHDGVWFYTIGQRGGWKMEAEAQRKSARPVKVQNEAINLQGQSLKAEMNTPIYYVISKDAKKNILIVGEAEEAKGDQFEISEINKISDEKWNLKEIRVRIRHGGEMILGRGMETEEGLVVVLDKSIRGIASGQSAVFYSEEGKCLGGGVIQ